MQDLIPIENTGKFPKPVAGRMIPPGEVRYFHARDLPAHLKPGAKPAEKPIEVDPNAAIKTLLTGSVKEVTAKLHLLSNADLEQVQIIEGMQQNRSTLLKAANEELLRRAEIMSDPDLSGFEKYQKLHKINGSKVTTVDQYILNNIIDVPLMHVANGEPSVG
ncbi:MULTISPECIES: hypothetical protein [unclassified Methylophaga]|jgi:hypothetical protein|uniref:hypothetical protein n=1 Tax=unclassified Methylophaga TaxID=2629249 RepID=UPI000C97B007|nr:MULTISPECIES: hypothetical protein [unclassified Methylophaga]MAY18735.1 hypothetical protein [Methylophaga sp.]HAO25016.1 hypothetical protein [Methylophaga sp.]HCD04475.1 hypothetical protein [Methylophaga sp.]|tara:strand:+ start:16765 stop:17250 length:486 start_codon:yes stop_codon:yes gene_type:complete